MRPATTVTQSWTEIIAPIVAKCVVGATFGDGVRWDAEGARAVGALLKTMAERLDAAIRQLEETPPMIDDKDGSERSGARHIGSLPWQRIEKAISQECYLVGWAHYRGRFEIAHLDGLGEWRRGIMGGDLLDEAPTHFCILVAPMCSFASISGKA